MLRNRTILLLAVLAVAVAFAPAVGRAATIITNTGYVDYTNEASAAQPVALGATAFTVAANPILSVAKTRDVGRGPSGTITTFTIKVTYPQIGADCTDDSNAMGIILRDTLPAGLEFASAEPTPFRVSYDNGGSWINLSTADDADEGEVDTAPAQDVITVNLTERVGYTSMPEGAGACVAGTARLIEVKARVQ